MEVNLDISTISIAELATLVTILNLSGNASAANNEAIIARRNELGYDGNALFAYAHEARQVLNKLAY